MDQSLIDFQGAANLSMNMQRMNMQEDQNRAANAQHAKQNRLTQLKAFADDPTVRANPDQLENIQLARAHEMGVPQFTRESFRAGTKSMEDMLNNLQSGDLQKAQQGLVHAFTTFTSDDAKRMIDATQEMPLLQERLLAIQQSTALNKEKMTHLQEIGADLKASDRPFTQAVKDISTILQGTDTNDFKRASSLAKIMRGEDGTTHVDMKSLPMNENTRLFLSPSFTQDAQKATEVVGRLNALSGETQLQLDQLTQGVPLPKGVTEAGLKAQLSMADTLGEAYLAVGQWAKDPFNQDKFKLASEAQKTIVTRRAELDKMKLTDAQLREEIATGSLAFRRTEAGQKHLYNTAIGNAQSEVLAQFGRTPSEKDLAAVAKKYGVQPAEILPGLAAPKHDVEGSLTADQSANLVIKTLAQAAGDAGAADVIDPVTGAVDFGRLIHKSARDQQAFIDSIRTKGKLKEFAGIKDSLEIVARDAERKLASTTASKKSVEDAKGQLPPVDDKEIQDAVATGKPFFYEKAGHKFKLEGKGKSRQWVVVE